MTTPEIRQARIDTASGIPGWMTRPELEWLHDTAASLPAGAVWVEVGSWCGRSFYAVASGLPAGSRLIAVDNYSLSARKTADVPTHMDAATARRMFYETLDQVQRDFPAIVCEMREGDSALVSETVSPGSCDVVFIDGTHTELAVMADIQAWRPKLKPCGILCGHDYGRADPGVILAVDKLLGAERGLCAPVDGANTIWAASF